MPMRGFALLLSTLALTTASSEVRAQAPRTPAASRGIVAGLPDDDDSLPVLVRLAMASNEYAPCFEPPTPTKGLWADCPPDNRFPSWQECFRSARDGLGWVFCGPTRNCGTQPPSDASLWDWMTHWSPTINRFSLTGTIGSTWDWLVQWLPHFGGDGANGTSMSPWDWLTQWLPHLGGDDTSDPNLSTWDWLMQWMPRLGSVSPGTARASQPGQAPCAVCP